MECLHVKIFIHQIHTAHQSRASQIVIVDGGAATNDGSQVRCSVIGVEDFPRILRIDPG